MLFSSTKRSMDFCHLSENLNSKHSQKFLNDAEQSSKDALITASKGRFKKQKNELLI